MIAFDLAVSSPVARPIKMYGTSQKQSYGDIYNVYFWTNIGRFCGRFTQHFYKVNCILLGIFFKHNFI